MQHIVAAERFAYKVYVAGQECSDADGNHRKNQSVRAPKERQQAASGAELGVNKSGSVVLRSLRADDADVAHTVTDRNWTVSDFPSGMHFVEIPSHKAKSASVKGSNALDNADQDPTDVRLDYGRVDIAGHRRRRMLLDGGTTYVNPTALIVDQTKIRKEKNSRQRSQLLDQIARGCHQQPPSDRKTDL